jgi:hypothetical protein
MTMRNKFIVVIIALFLKTLPLSAAPEEQDQEIIDNLDFLIEFQIMDNLDLAEHYDVLYATVPVEAEIDNSRGETDEDN